jgi:hypothetical protein
VRRPAYGRPPLTARVGLRQAVRGATFEEPVAFDPVFV